MVLAHPEPGGHGMIAGLQHPLHGLDHLFVMLSVGLWAALLGGRATWMVPLSFVTMMAVSACIGAVGIPFGVAELGIPVSIVVLALLLVGRVRTPLLFAIGLAGVFAVFHGYVHGAEIQGESPATFITGFAVTTAFLHLTGIGLGKMLARQELLYRFLGALILVGGLLG
jgi:urease accessory protein